MVVEGDLPGQCGGVETQLPGSAWDPGGSLRAVQGTLGNAVHFEEILFLESLDANMSHILLPGKGSAAEGRKGGNFAVDRKQNKEN